MSSNDLDAWSSTWLDEIALAAAAQPLSPSAFDVDGFVDEPYYGAAVAHTASDVEHTGQRPTLDDDSARTTPALTASLSLGSRSRSSSVHTAAACDTEESEGLAVYNLSWLFGTEQDGAEGEVEAQEHHEHQEAPKSSTLPIQGVSWSTSPHMLGKRGRNSDDEDDVVDQTFYPVVKKRREALPTSWTREAAQREESAVRGTASAAWQGPDASEASTSAQASAQQTSPAAPGDSVPHPQSKPLEMCRAIRVIQEFARRRMPSISQAAQAIADLPRNAPPSSLPARKQLNDADKALLRDIGPNVPGRRASLRDVRYTECTACATDYGIPSEPILRSRLKTHKAEYHQGRMCSACGVPVNGRDTDKARVHRMSCAIWHALVEKGFYKAWLGKNGYYTDEGLKREFWNANQRRAAKELARGNTEREIEELEKMLRSVEVAGLESLLGVSDDDEERTTSAEDRVEIEGQQDAPEPPAPASLADTATVDYQPWPTVYQERWMPWEPLVAWGYTTATGGASFWDVLGEGADYDAQIAAPVAYEERWVPLHALVTWPPAPSATFEWAQDLNDWLDCNAFDIGAYGHGVALQSPGDAQDASSDLCRTAECASGVREGEPRDVANCTQDASITSMAATLPISFNSPGADSNTAYFNSGYIQPELDGYDGAFENVFDIAQL